MSFLSWLKEGLEHDMEVYHKNRPKVYVYAGTAEQVSYMNEGARVLARVEAQERIEKETDPYKKKQMQALYDAGIYNFDKVFDYVNQTPI